MVSRPSRRLGSPLVRETAFLIAAAPLARLPPSSSMSSGRRSTSPERGAWRVARWISGAAGAAPIELYRTETAHYRDNLQMEAPLLWIILRPVEGDPPYELAAVTADPAEGEGMTEAGSNIVEAVTMPEQLRETVALNFGELPMEFAIVGEVPPLRTIRPLLKGSAWRVALGE